MTPSLPPSEHPWHQMAIADLVSCLETDGGQGLTPEQIPLRRERYGSNELTSKTGKSPLERFLLGFKQPLIYILLVAGGVTLLLRDWVDAGVILGVTLINAIIGFLQESKAENTLAALAKSVSTEATVLRGGQKKRLNARELVPGDLVLLTAGDKVPADLRLIQLRDLQVSEAALTGESLPVQKSLDPLYADTPLTDRHNMAYASSLITAGQGRGLVVAIGNQTQTGRISQLMAKSGSLETPLTRKIEKFSQTLLYGILTLATALFAVVIGKGGHWADGFKSAVALAVSAIPEGLPAVVTVTLAIGVNRMAQRHAIIRKLPAVETLGSTTVVCSDKTGTLTENQMTVQQIWAGEQFYDVTGVGYDAEGEILHQGKPVDLDQHPALKDCLLCGFLCNDAHLQVHDGQLTVAGDPTEGALIVTGQKAGGDRQALEQSQPRLDALPFESQFQYMATLHQRSSGEHCIYLKGSVEAVVQRCDRQWQGNSINALDQSQRDTITATMQTMAAQGLRVLAFAQKVVTAEQQTLNHSDLETGLVFLGLQGMIDPPRPKAISAVKACQTAGIQVKMITGDHAVTAQAIAQQLGISPVGDAPVFTGQELAAMAETELANAVETSNVFARVDPEQKLRLVEALQAKGEVVAMTGDGVNDAPALKKANISIAMGITGTEVAKEAANMILTDDNFASIEAAVEEGRTVYRNLLKTIGFILPVNGGEALTIMAGILLLEVLPILPVQILWVNMVSSVALSATLAFEPKADKTMQRPPRPPHEPLLTPQLLWRIGIIGFFNLLVVFGMFELTFQKTDNIDLARTMAVLTLVAAETFYLLSISKFIPSLWATLRSKTESIAYVPAIGVLCVVISQFLFSQMSLMNGLFSTHPLNSIQSLICISIGALVIIPALLLKRFAALT
ncbi:MAG: HAD-IC family P-type ATPase [Synechocystis sp.]|nr:HAD-IC family P-type ATPase [Synechocystis sp.]